MKTKHIILLAAMSLSVAACSDLSYNEVTTQDKDWVLKARAAGVERLVTNVYSYLDYDYGNNYSGAMRASATDESEYVWPTNDIHTFYDGSWSAINHNSNSWNNYYNAIRAANFFLEEATRLDFSEFKHNPDYADFMKKYAIFPHEVRFLRAYYYFMLVREYGDVPYIDMLTPSEANKVSRTDYKTIFEYIVKECDYIVERLPVRYDDSEDPIPGKETGRITKACALALKARVLLYYASPLFNPGDNTLWERAAQANLAVIESCTTWKYSLGNYRDIWGTDKAYKNAEFILRRPIGNTSSVEGYNYPISVENGKSGNCPTQNLVDAYQMQASGLLWNEAASGYDATKPYEGRDPRFRMTVVVNGDKNWPNYNGTPIETFVGGNSGQPLNGATTTGYYLKKHLDPSVDLRPNSAKQTQHTWAIFRLGEFYLNYAEAVYKVKGSAEAKDATYRLSANEAVNAVRSRADVMMPAFTGETNFEANLMRERMVELAFEGHRYWDVRRWKKGADFFSSITRMEITKESVSGALQYRRVERPRKWEDRMYFSPIPDSERRKNPNLRQNTGW